MKILMTGIRGYVGANLVKTLKGEHSIYGLDVVNTGMEGVKEVFLYTELNQVPEVDIVIHLAGKARETNDYQEALACFESNACLTRDLFNWFANSSSKEFVYFSSVKAVTHKGKGAAVSEDTDMKPFGDLGERKLLAERYILSQNVENKKIYVLRSGILVGNGSLGNKNLRWMYGWVKRGYPFPFGNFECSRSFTTMDNLFFVLKKIFERDIPSGIYNVADDGFLSATEVFEIMGSVLRKNVRIWRLNPGFVKFASKIGTKFNLTFNEYRFDKVSSNLTVNNEKIKKALGIRKMPIRTVDGVEKAIRDYNPDIYANHT